MSKTTFGLVPYPDSMDTSNMTTKECFTTADTTELIKSHFETSDKSILVGVWECAPCVEKIDAYPVHEMMTLIAGALTLTHADGRVEQFKTGDTFFIAKGTPLTWEITEKLRKYYMIAA